MYRYNASRKYIEWVSESDSLLKFTAGYHLFIMFSSIFSILTVGTYVIDSGSFSSTAKSISIASIVILIITLVGLFTNKYTYDEYNLSIKYTCPFISIPLLIILVMDTIIFILCTFSVPIRWIVLIIYGIYGNVAEAKKVRDKAKADRLRARERYIHKFRVELENDINGW